MWCARSWLGSRCTAMSACSRASLARRTCTGSRGSGFRVQDARCVHPEHPGCTPPYPVRVQCRASRVPAAQPLALLCALAEQQIWADAPSRAQGHQPAQARGSQGRAFERLSEKSAMRPRLTQDATCGRALLPSASTAWSGRAQRQDADLSLWPAPLWLCLEASRPQAARQQRCLRRTADTLHGHLPGQRQQERRPATPAPADTVLGGRRAGLCGRCARWASPDGRRPARVR